MNQDMKGVSSGWFEICNVDGHPLVLDQENRFQSEELAAQKAVKVAVDYRDTVTVKEHVATIRRIFRVKISAEEV